MKWALKREVDRLEVAVLKLRGELRRALRSPTSEQVREAISETKKLSTNVKQLADLVEQMKE